MDTEALFSDPSRYKIRSGQCPRLQGLFGSTYHSRNATAKCGRRGGKRHWWLASCGVQNAAQLNPGKSSRRQQTRPSSRITLSLPLRVCVSHCASEPQFLYICVKLCVKTQILGTREMVYLGLLFAGKRSIMVVIRGGGSVRLLVTFRPLSRYRER